MTDSIGVKTDNTKELCFSFVEQVQSSFSREFQLNKPSGQEPMVSDRTGFIFWNSLSQSGVFEGSAVVEFYTQSLNEIVKQQFYEMARVQSRVFLMNRNIERPKAIVTAKVELSDGTVNSQIEQLPNAGLWKGTVVFTVECDFAIL